MPALPDLPPGYAQRMPHYPEATALVDIGPDSSGRPALLDPSAALAWQAMHEAAALDQCRLILVSAFRSLAYQEQLLRRKIDRGIPWEEILAVSAYPGFSEHHTGRALDLGSPHAPDLEESFEHTPEFLWLSQRAPDFGFHLTYPRDNPFGIIYEPWHWAFTPADPHRPPPIR